MSAFRGPINTGGYVDIIRMPTSEDSTRLGSAIKASGSVSLDPPGFAEGDSRIKENRQ